MPVRANAQSGEVKVTPEMYQRVFEGHAEGALVLEDLVKKFGAGKAHVEGGIDAVLKTYRSIGERRPLDFILSQINRAHGAETEEAPE
jgi:hypothetical protein